MGSIDWKIIDVNVGKWMARYCITFLRISVALVFIWYGAVKFFPEYNPVQAISSKAIEALSFGMLDSEIGIIILASVECVIGIGLLTNRLISVVLGLLAIQMLGTFLCLFLFQEDVFVHVPYAPTLEGQMILKNLVIMGAAMVVGATSKGGAIATNDNIIGKL